MEHARAVEVAERYLTRNGYLIVDDAVSSHSVSGGDPERIAQVDIIAQSPKDDEICFIEVYGRDGAMSNYHQRLNAADMQYMSDCWRRCHPEYFKSATPRYDYLLVTGYGAGRCLIQHRQNSYVAEEVVYYD